MTRVVVQRSASHGGSSARQQAGPAVQTPQQLPPGTSETEHGSVVESHSVEEASSSSSGNRLGGSLSQEVDTLQSQGGVTTCRSPSAAATCQADTSREVPLCTPPRSLSGDLSLCLERLKLLQEPSGRSSGNSEKDGDSPVSEPHSNTANHIESVNNNNHQPLDHQQQQQRERVNLSHFGTTFGVLEPENKKLVVQEETPASSSSTNRVPCSIGTSSSSSPTARTSRSGSLKKSSVPSSQKLPSPPDSKSPSPRARDADGYNSADEHGGHRDSRDPHHDGEREHAFEAEISRTKNLRVHRMVEDGNCLFRAVAYQVYGDSEMCYDTRHMCIDYMEKERDHFSQFVTENFSAYCKRKRRDKVYGNNLEIQAMAEMYNRPIHIYSYSSEPINIFHGTYQTDLPPIRLSYHRGNHYNSLVDPSQPVVGAGLGFGSLRGKTGSQEMVKAAIKAQQDQQIEKALLTEGKYYSDLEVTEKQLEQSAMEASLDEFILHQRRVSLIGSHETSDSASGRPSSSYTASRTGSLRNTSETLGTSSLGNSHGGGGGGGGGGMAGSRSMAASGGGGGVEGGVLTANTRLLMSMGFNYMRVMESQSIFGDDLDNMLCFLIEMGERERQQEEEDSARLKGKERLK